MPKDFEETSVENINWERYIGIARRRAWHFLIPFFAGWLIIWLTSWFLPSVYRSGTLIIVEQPTVPSSLVASNISSDLQSRLNSISEQILSRTRLLHIIDQFNLYNKDRARSSPDDLVQRMRKDIEIELQRTPGGGELSTFNVYYSSRDPKVAQEVTSELTNLFINENLEVRRQQSENTTKFLQDQLDRAQQSLSEQEDKVRQFEDAHLGDLPGQLQSNLEILHGMQAQLQSEQGLLNGAKERNVYLESLLGQYRSLQTSVTTTNGETLPYDLPAIDQELNRLRAQLADLSSRYTDQYPDVRKVKDQIAKTEQMKKQVAAELLKPTPVTNQTPANTSVAGYSKETGPILEMQSQLKANEIEIANREVSIKEITGKIGQYQDHLHDAPIREQQLAELTRGYDQSKADYDALLKKKNDSELATNLEYEQQGEHFRILDPPSLPAKPFSPNRMKFFAAGLAIGFFLGLAAALATEFLDKRIYTEAEFCDIVPSEVLVEIPVIATLAEEQQYNRSTWLQVAAASAVAVTVFLGLAITFLRG
jgi:polysaccharide biosynthesis transport protein